MELRNKTKSTILANKLSSAFGIVDRAIGLLGRSELPAGEGLWIKPCNNIHTFFMKFNIDAVFVDKNLIVQSVHSNIKPYRLIWPQWKSQSVFELPAGQAGLSQTEKGDQLNVVS